MSVQSHIHKVSHSYTEISESELISGLKSGNSKYFSLFTVKYEDYIKRKCIRYVKDPELAEDLKQEILIKVFLQVSGFREDARISTWLYAIIHNTCIDYLRKNKKNVYRVLSKELASELITEIEDENAPEALNVEILDELLESLSPEGKLIILLKYKEKHSIKDIQNTLGLSESAVKMRLKRTRELLNRLYFEKSKGSK